MRGHRSSILLLSFVLLFAISIVVQAGQHDELVKKAMKMWNERDLDIADEIYAKDFVSVSNNGQEGETRGPAAIKASIKKWMEEAPDFKVEPIDIITEGDKVVTFWRFTFTSQITGEKIATTGMTLTQVKDGKIIKSWWANDSLIPALQQGFTLTPPAEK